MPPGCRIGRWVTLDGRALAAMEISTWRTDARDVDVLAFVEEALARIAAAMLDR